MLLACDVETLTYASGNPYSSCAKLVSIHATDGEQCWSFKPEQKDEIQHLFNKASTIVWFNGKFDIAHLRKLDLVFPKTHYDVQLAHFYITNQSAKFPSLEGVAEFYNVPGKIDLIKEEYWENKCSCHVSLVKRLLSTMLKVNVGHVTPVSMNTPIELLELLEKTSYEKQIQYATNFLKSKNVSAVLQILRTRLIKINSTNAINTSYPLTSTMLLWLEQAVKCVENLKSLYVSTTATLPVKLEECCVDTVMQLLVMLKNTNGWLEHSNICTPTPVDTDKVPWDILCEYGEQDVKLTLQLYHKQQEHWNSHPQKHKLFKLACMDLLVLQEMEHNGLFYNEELCYQKSEQLQKDIKQLTDKLSNVYPNIPINFNSSQQLSSFLYGGPIVTESKELIGFYKGGQKAGQPKYKNVEMVHQLPRLFKPLPKSEMAKEGVFSTSEPTLQKLKGKHYPYVKMLLELAKLTKLDETYYKGLTKLNKEMMWPTNYLHGQFNQCIAVTGRLSSSKPNLQNLSNDSLDIFTSRYE